MKATHTKAYYDKYREEFFKKYREELFKKYSKECDYEHKLLILLPDLSALPAEQKAKAETVVTKLTAEKIANSAKQDLIEKMRMIQDIKSGRASLGYTTEQQEARAMHDLIEGFEFSCFMLSEFKSKYGIG